jgi:quinol monooxygenase YgiN
MRLGPAVLALGLIAAAPLTHAVAANQSAYVVTYIDVLPEAVAQAREVLLRYLHSDLEARGRRSASALQEIRRPERLALLEIWDSAADWQAQRTAPPMRALSDQLAAVSAGYEDRRLFEARSNADAGTMDFDAPLQSIAHLDLALPLPAEAEQFIAALAAQVRTLPGNLGATLLRQADRGNHLTLWLQWQDEGAWRASLSSPLMRRMRALLGPQLGSPFDERVYQLLH